MILTFLINKNTPKRNNIYVLGKDFIQGFSTDGGGHTIDKQKLFFSKTNFSQVKKRFITTLQ